MFITQAEIDQLIKEDLASIDLTSVLLHISTQPSEISFTAQEVGIAAGTLIIEKIFTTLGLTTVRSKTDGDPIYKGDEIICATGPADTIHKGWLVAHNILGYCCGVASYTRKMVDICKAQTPSIKLLLNRKHIPGTKALAISALIAGGAVPHQLSLSDTIVIFKEHHQFFPGKTTLADNIANMKRLTYGKKILVDSRSARSLEAVSQLARAGANIIQFHNIPAKELKPIIRELRRDFPKLGLFINGYIDLTNIQEYIASGIDTIVTSSSYFAKPLDIVVDIKEIHSH